MSIFNEIRPEEIESGFQQPEPGYEGFVLKPEDTYPGEFPIFQDEVIIEDQFEEQAPLENIPEVSEGIIDAASLEGNIWGAFDQEQPLRSSSEPESQSEIIKEESIPEFVPDETKEIQSTKIEDEFADLESSFSQETISQAQKEPQAISIDEELKKLLQEELERKKKKETQQETKIDSDTIEPIIEPQEKPNFIPVEETGGKVEFIDMSALDPNLPRVDLGMDDLSKPIEVIPEKKSKTKEKVEKVKPPKKEKGERKSRKVFVWLLSSVAGLLIISTISYFGFNYFLKSIISPQKDTTLTRIDTLNPKKINHKEEKHNEPQHQKVQQNVDTTITIAEKPKIETQPHHENKQEITHNETPKVIEKETIKTTNQITPKPIEKNQPTVATRSHFPKKSKLPQAKPEKKTDIASITSQTKPIETTPPITEKQIYTIQVYATPSAEDAEFWRQKLIAMKLNDVYISTQKVRDVIWYRVRFGKFTNRQQALDAAKQFGFSQTWVDRIQ